MNKIATILVMIAIMILAPTMALGVDQAYHTTLGFRGKGDESAQSQWTYGNLEFVWDDTDFIVTSAFTSTGGIFTIDLETGAGGALTTVWTSEPISGNGTAGNAVTMTGDKGDITATAGTIAIDDDAVDDTDIDVGTGAGQINTADITELTNLYYTDERSEDALGAALRDTATVNATYTDASSEFTWDVLLTGIIGGSDSHVQYNNGGVFGGEADFVWDDTNNQLIIGAPASTAVHLDLIVDGEGAYVGSIYSGDDVHIGYSGISGLGEALGTAYWYNGGGEDFEVWYPDLNPGIDAGMAWPTDAPLGGNALMVTSVDLNGNAIANWTTPTDTDTNTHVDSIFGYLLGATAAGTDQYAVLENATAYAGTGATDSIGFSMPWACSIVGISANYKFTDGDQVATITIYPREDGANIHADCKLILAESATIDSVSATFAAGTYTVSANQALGIYLDFSADTGAPAVLTDLVVTVYYTFSL